MGGWGALPLPRVRWGDGGCSAESNPDSSGSIKTPLTRRKGAAHSEPQNLPPAPATGALSQPPARLPPPPLPPQPGGLACGPSSQSAFIFIALGLPGCRANLLKIHHIPHETEYMGLVKLQEASRDNVIFCGHLVKCLFISSFPCFSHPQIAASFFSVCSLTTLETLVEQGLRPQSLTSTWSLPPFTGALATC